MIMGARRTFVSFVALTVALELTFVVPQSSSPPTSTAEAALRKSVTSDYTLLPRGPRS